METPRDPQTGGADGAGLPPDDRPAAPDLAPQPMTPPPASAATPADAPPPMATPPVSPPPPIAAPAQAWEAPEAEAGPAPGYAFGGAGERLVAYIVDALIITGLLILVGLAGLLLAFVLPILALLVWFLGGLAVGLGYFPYFWVKSGQTPGLRMFQMRVVRDQDGGPIGVGSALLRLFGLYVLDGLVLYLGFIWIFIDKRKRCWHDLIAGTVVVKRA